MTIISQPLVKQVGNARSVIRRERRLKRASTIALGSLGFVLVIGLWQATADLRLISTFFISSPSSVLSLLQHWAESGIVVSDFVATATESILGLLIGISVGIILALGLYASKTLQRTLFPLLTVLMGLPRVVMAPLFILWFGIGTMSKVWLGVSVVSLVVFFSTYSGLTQTDSKLITKTRLLGGSTWQVYRYVLAPSVFVWTMSSIRTSMGIAITAAVVGEYLGSVRGIGYLIAQAQGNLDATGVYAGLALTALLVLVIEAPVRYVESYFSRWQQVAI